MTFGSTSSTVRSSQLWQLSTSAGCGWRLPGGRQRRTFVRNTSSRASPASPSSWWSSLPAWPTNGSPIRSSLAPGASPTNMRSASALPEPKTTVERVAASCGQRVQPRHSWNSAFSASRRSSADRSEEHTSELQSRQYIVCRLLPEKKIAGRFNPPALRRTWQISRELEAAELFHVAIGHKAVPFFLFRRIYLHAVYTAFSYSTTSEY